MFEDNETAWWHHEHLFYIAVGGNNELPWLGF
jgi:hypothetical protein